MNQIIFFYVILIVIISGIIDQVECYTSGVRLKDTDFLVFRSGQFTSNRKGGHHEPQLKCLGGPSKCKFQPKLVKCFNQGTKGSGKGYKNILWRCEADLAEGYSFDKVRVTCEPFEHSNEMVVKDSCGLEYALDYDDDDDDDKDKEKTGDRNDRVKKEKDLGYWVTYLITKIPRKSFEFLFKNFLSSIIFSTVVYLFFYGWPDFSRRRRRRSPTPTDDYPEPSNTRSRFGRDRDESIWTTIIKVILEFAFEKLLKTFIR